MFSLFSSISGKLSTSTLMGTSLPVLLFLSFLVWIVEPIAPGILPVPEGFKALDPQWKGLALTVLLALLTGVLSNINHLLVKFYADMPIPGAAWFQKRLKTRLESSRPFLVDLFLADFRTERRLVIKPRTLLGSGSLVVLARSRP